MWKMKKTCTEFPKTRHHVKVRNHGLLFGVREPSCCSITGQIQHKNIPKPRVTNYMFTSLLAVFKLHFYSKQDSSWISSLLLWVEIVICTELGGWLLGARIPGLFFWCLLNVAASRGGEAGDELSCVNNLWHIPSLMLTKPWPSRFSLVLLESISPPLLQPSSSVIRYGFLRPGVKPQI